MSVSTPLRRLWFSLYLCLYPGLQESIALTFNKEVVEGIPQTLGMEGAMRASLLRGNPIAKSMLEACCTRTGFRNSEMPATIAGAPHQHEERLSSSSTEFHFA